MRDLRDGVKLKKVQERQYNPLAIEYQLTPYEMLMDDIRSKRYKLRKVMVRHKFFYLALFSMLQITRYVCITSRLLLFFFEKRFMFIQTVQ